MNETKETQNDKQGFLRKLGPGLITGAADDDPSGISTYSTAGAAYGFGLFWSAVLNGVLAPPLIIIILFICNNRRVMGEHTNGKTLNILGTIAALVMSAAAIALLVGWLLA